MDRKEALTKHRMMWNKIAELIEKGIKYEFSREYKYRALIELGLQDDRYKLQLDCYCCEVSDDCKNCLVIWSGKSGTCCNNEGEYEKFCDAIKSGNFVKAKRIAENIANLPEREHQEE